ncbi:MAG: hypothetical protein OET16_06475 [Chromatiales bacterium]|nr:hypothetical protein [Chromatiales bacterium]MDH3931855.1 hypothetical protein [Chromatiales bacterium]MDH3945312.1 hypothetical protein [Chromatiales bacterium]
MNWKIVFIGGLACYVAQWIAGFVTGAVIHEGILDPVYIATPQFWRPELVQDPPDIMALLPRWISAGLIGSFLFAGIYSLLRHAFAGPGWLRGLKFGLMVAVIAASAMLGWSGVLALPDVIWAWWAFESFIYYPLGGAVLGWVAARLVPDPGLSP